MYGSGRIITFSSIELHFFYKQIVVYNFSVFLLHIHDCLLTLYSFSNVKGRRNTENTLEKYGEYTGEIRRIHWRNTENTLKKYGGKIKEGGKTERRKGGKIKEGGKKKKKERRKDQGRRKGGKKERRKGGKEDRIDR